MMVAMVARISSKPSGAKIHLMAFENMPRMESSSSMSGLNPPFPKTEPTQTTMDAMRMTVPAFLMKDEQRSHMLRRMAPTVGI